jgi:hypothetical protein
LNEADINDQLNSLKPEIIQKLHEAAAATAGLGSGSNIYKLTVPK